MTSKARLVCSIFVALLAFKAGMHTVVHIFQGSLDLGLVIAVVYMIIFYRFANWVYTINYKEIHPIHQRFLTKLDFDLNQIIQNRTNNINENLIQNHIEDLEPNGQ